MEQHNNGKLFSVIIPVYNVEKYLRQCVESVLVQTYREYEIILVDDGSKDSSGAMCDRFAEEDSRIKVIHKPNGGLSDARNVGTQAAEGTYICYLDSDDYWSDPCALEKIAAAAQKDGADLIQFGVRKYYQLQDKLEQKPPRDVARYEGLSAEDVLYTMVKSGDLNVSACLMAMKREYLLQHDLSFVKGLKSEDIEWAIRLYSHIPTWTLLPDHFYVYRMQREGSITASVDYPHLKGYCDILEQSVAVVEKTAEKVYEALMNYIMYHSMIVSALSYRVALTGQQKAEIRGAMKQLCRKYLGKYHTLNKKVKMAHRVYGIFGYGAMARVLGFYLNHRGR